MGTENVGVSGYIFLMLVGAGIAGLINKRQGRTVVMPFTIGAITVLAVWFTEIIVGIYLIRTRNISAYRSGYLMTAVILDGLVALVPTVILAVFDRRRRLAHLASNPGAESQSSPK